MEASVDWVFVATWCLEQCFVLTAMQQEVLLLSMSRGRMRKAWKALLMHLVDWEELSSLFFQLAALYDFK